MLFSGLVCLKTTATHQRSAIQLKEESEAEGCEVWGEEHHKQGGGGELIKGMDYLFAKQWHFACLPNSCCVLSSGPQLGRLPHARTHTACSQSVICLFIPLFIYLSVCLFVFFTVSGHRNRGRGGVADAGQD